MKDFVSKGFSTPEKLILALYYYEQMTMKEIGQTLGISESRVSPAVFPCFVFLRMVILREISTLYRKGRY